MRFAWPAVAGLILLSAAAGCATWDLPASPAEFNLPMPSADTHAVVYETAFIRWPGNEGDVLWKEVDEQFLPPHLRQELAANGLRAGILSDPLPEAIRNSLDASSDPLAVITDQNAVPGAEVLTRRERRQCPARSREEIEVLPPGEEQRIVLFNELGRVRAISFEQPRGYLRLNLAAVGDGRVQIELVPVIEFGKPKQRVIGGQNAYRVEVRRELEEFASLAIASTLRSGQTLVLTATTDKKGLGAIFFADRFEAEQDRLLLLFRIAEAGPDELFAPRREQEPLVTPLR